MARISFSGFRDPVRRPRLIIWSLVAVIAFGAIMLVLLGVTSTRWFCSNACHKVQDDTIIAYQHSSHSEISCMACHMPVNSSPIVFMLHKVEALKELYETVTNTYTLPLNPEDEVSLTMKSTQCTQCHDENKRVVTPKKGLKIDHAVHAKNGVDCTICHNRIAHREDFNLTLKNPKTGVPNHKHPDFVQMTACFRCHSQDYKAENKPPGTCETCHTQDFELKPPSHLQPGFFPDNHGKLGAAEESRTIAAGGTSWLSSEPATATTSTKSGEAEAKPEEGETLGQTLPKVEQINECSTCHESKFCVDCHGGVPMPHPSDWAKKHGLLGKKVPAACANCHGAGNAGCNSCHHGTQVNWTYNPTEPWRQQHPKAVAKNGAAGCFECHNPTYCSSCHVNGGVPPKR